MGQFHAGTQGLGWRRPAYLAEHLPRAASAWGGSTIPHVFSAVRIYCPILWLGNELLAGFHHIGDSARWV